MGGIGAALTMVSARDRNVEMISRLVQSPTAKECDDQEVELAGASAMDAERVAGAQGPMNNIGATLVVVSDEGSKQGIDLQIGTTGRR